MVFGNGIKNIQAAADNGVPFSTYKSVHCTKMWKTFSKFIGILDLLGLDINERNHCELDWQETWQFSASSPANSMTNYCHWRFFFVSLPLMS